MIPNTKFAFFGSPRFAAIILEKLIAANMPPTLVVCNPDRPSGRKQIITPPPTKILAEKHSIPVWQPEKLEIGKNVTLRQAQRIKLLVPEPVEGLPLLVPEPVEGLQLFSGLDFAVVAAYAKILPKKVIDAFPRGIIGVHPSLLPKYRGATPIQSALLAGEKETGTTLFLLDEKVDHGPILAQRELEFPISNFQFPALLEKLAGLSGDLLVETLPKFVKGEIKPVPQNEAEATYTKKFKSEDGFVDNETLRRAQGVGGGIKDVGGEAAIKIDRMIRALNPEPGVWTLRNGKRVKLLGAELVGSELKLKKIQIEGKKAMLLGLP